MANHNGAVRIAAVADLHLQAAAKKSFQPLFAQAEEEADILVLCGDLTDYGLPEEAHLLASELAPLSLPVVAVLGNHDYETGKQDEVRHILAEAGVHVLDGESCEVKGVGFAGAKGFCGGFGRRSLEPWGEPPIKHFVQEAMDEAMKLGMALSRLRTRHRIALLHYSPVEETVVGEPHEIFPFMGSSRLEEPLNRYDVTAVFHGHAHRGAPEGRTQTGTPVYNVSLPLMRATSPERPFYLLELSNAPVQDEPSPAAS